MPDPAVTVSDPSSRPRSGEERRRQFTASLPMRTALLAVAAVWFLGAVWSYTEQSAFAANKGFAFPHLLPLVIDGFAVAMAGVAWAASLDARPAVAARLATLVAVCASSASNGAWAWIRSNHDTVAVLLGVAVPVAANLAFEVLLAELRRQVQRRRGLPPPVAIPYPRLIRLVLAPWRSFGEWRAMVLDLTAMEHTVAPSGTAPALTRSSTAPSAIPPGTAPRVTVPVVSPVTSPLATTTAAAPLTAPPEPPASPAPVTPGSMAPPDPAPAEPERAATPSRAPAIRRSRTTGAVENGAGPTRPIGTGSAGPEPGGVSTNGSATNGSATNGSATNGSASRARSETGTTGRSDRRSVDGRVEMLAAHLASTEDAGEFTGEMVGPLLGIEVAPRTGRRLLGQARELVAERARAEAEPYDSGLRVIGAR